MSMGIQRGRQIVGITLIGVLKNAVFHANGWFLSALHHHFFEEWETERAYIGTEKIFDYAYR